MQIREPISEDDFVKYYALRYKMLRQPWNQPLGSEKADDDHECFHAMICNDEQDVLAVCRLQMNSPTEAQIRFMAVDSAHQKKGLGRGIIDYVENVAISKGADKLVLDARDYALPFYEKTGYRVVGESYLLFGVIKHFRMEKLLRDMDAQNQVL
jgi:predicted GNAT family N-acyltransferase